MNRTTNTAETPQRHPYRAFILRGGLGAALIAVLLWHYDPRPALDALARERIGYFVAAVLIYVAGQAMSAYRWRLLARLLHIPGQFRVYLGYYFIGMFTNLFVPGLVGGDAARALYLGRRYRRYGDAIAAVVADRGIGLVALFWFAAGAAVIVHSLRLPVTILRPTTIVGALALAGWLASPLLARAARWLPQKLRAFSEPAIPYLERPWTLIPAILLSFILQASLAYCQYLLAVGIGLELPLGVFMLCVPIANVFASLPITLNGLGVREAAYLLLLSFAGVAHGDAIALGLLWFVATLIGGFSGLWPFVTVPLPAPGISATASDSSDPIEQDYA